MTFSSAKRDTIYKSLITENFDLLIIGGGITGAGIAFDAATRGMKVALIDMQDFAAGTSSRSTKLVHGGLRYLKQFEFKMVAEVGKERAIVYENGPHVTTPVRMLLPIYKDGAFGKVSTSLGLRLYDYLAGVKKTERRKMLSANETLQKEPLLKKNGLLGSGYYVEYRTDDARLTIEILKSAVENGATAINYVKMEQFVYHDKKIIGAKVRDILTNTTYTIQAKKIVNATGPWVEQICRQDYLRNNKKLRITKGTHIVIDQVIFPLKQAVYFDTPDGRMVFAIPRAHKVYVGTTDTFYDQEITCPKATIEDFQYLIQAIHYMFPEVNLSEKDIESSWAGVRPLIYEEGKNPSEISRKDEIWMSESGLITIAGGKLTGYRKMAETVVNLVSHQFTLAGYGNFSPCKTKKLFISGGDVGGANHLAKFIEKKTIEALRYGLKVEEGKQLVQIYGSNIDQIFEIIQQYSPYEDSTVPAALYAQVIYAIHYEMATNPVDFFIRRTVALYFNINWVEKWKKPVLDLMAKELSWTEEIKIQYSNLLEIELKNATL